MKNYGNAIEAMIILLTLASVWIWLIAWDTKAEEHQVAAQVIECEIETVSVFEVTVETMTAEQPEEPENAVFIDPTVCEPTVEQTEVSIAENAIYSVNGAVLDAYLQNYLRDQLKARGVEDEYVFQICLCELYQESQFYYRADNGEGDKGLCQFREIYFPEKAEGAGLYEWDLMNPIDSLFAYAWYTAENLNKTGWNIAETLKLYFNSGDQASDEQYVRDVLQWLPTVEKQ